MNIIVRNEEPKDHRRTEEVAREAFWNLYFPGATEHYVVHKMRAHPDFIILGISDEMPSRGLVDRVALVQKFVEDYNQKLSSPLKNL